MPEKLGITLHPAGGGFRRGDTLVDAGDLLIDPQSRFAGLTWAELVAAASSSGDVDAPVSSPRR